MTRAKAIEALDSAFADSVKSLFNVLVLAMVTNAEDGAADKFHSGIEARDSAYAIAMKEIETIFPE